MCYSIYLATDSDEDLDALPKNLFRFERDDSLSEPWAGDLFSFPNRWFLSGRNGGCSCHYRTLGFGSDLYFGPPEDWSPEDDEDVESTIAVYEVFSRLVASGNQVEILTLWSDTVPDQATTMEVSLSDVPAEAFRFFEGKKFVLRS